LVAAFLYQVEARTHNRGTGEERQQHGDNAGLEGALHGEWRWYLSRFPLGDPARLRVIPS
jgi:hypothetical protein